MGLAELIKEFGGGPLAVVAGGLFLAAGVLFWQLVTSLQARIARAELQTDLMRKNLEEEQARHEAALSALNKENRQEVLQLNMATQLLLAYLDKRGARKEKETAHVQPK